MKRLFVATSFSGHVNYETGVVNPDHRQKIEDILTALREVGGLTVFCAVEHEGWIVSDAPAEIGVKKDLDEIDKSDVILALLPVGLISAGLHYESGYADKAGKQVILATEAGTELDYFSQGVVDLSRVAHIEYEDPQQLATNLLQIIG